MPDTTLSLVTSHASQQRAGRVTLLERKTALDALAEITAQARSGEGRLVLVEGEAGFAYTNLHELHYGSRDYAQADPYFHDGVAYCEDHDLGTYLNCLRGVRTASLDRLGRWDESAAIAEAVIASAASPVNRMIPMTAWPWSRPAATREMCGRTWMPR